VRLEEYKPRKRNKGTGYPMKVIWRMAVLWNDERWMGMDEIAAMLNLEFKHDPECGPLNLTRGKIAGLIDRARHQKDMPAFYMRGQANGRGSRAGALATNIKKRVRKRGENTNPIGPDLDKVRHPRRKGDKSFNQRYTRHGQPVAAPKGAHERAMKEFGAKQDAFKPLDGHDPVSYVNLLSHHCRWPVDGPDGKTWYCGRDRIEGKKPYCATHVRK
jgi:hypothetical protein